MLIYASVSSSGLRHFGLVSLMYEGRRVAQVANGRLQSFTQRSCHHEAKSANYILVLCYSHLEYQQSGNRSAVAFSSSTRESCELNILLGGSKRL